MSQQTCVFCEGLGGELLWQDEVCRVVLVDDADYIGFCRVILKKHVKEMTDLTEFERSRLMRVVFVVERVLRDVLQPDKINLASLGNKTPHIHWHVIPRFNLDKHFPETIWSAAVRKAEKPNVVMLREALESKIADALPSR